MIDARGVEALAFGQEPMQAGDADVVEPVDVVAHDLGRDWRLPLPLVCQKFPPLHQDDTLAARRSARAAR